MLTLRIAVEARQIDDGQASLCAPGSCSIWGSSCTLASLLYVAVEFKVQRGGLLEVLQSAQLLQRP